MTPSFDLSNVAKGGDPSSIHGALPATSGSVMSTAGVPVTNIYGLRRWRAAYADALFAEAPIVMLGDSRVFGEFANGSLTTTAADGAADGPLAIPRQMGLRFASSYGDPGEGFIFASSVRDNRVVVANGGTFQGVGQAASALRDNYRLTSNTATITMVMPAGCTRLGVIQCNFPGSVNISAWSLGGTGQGALPVAPTSTGIPTIQYLTVTPGSTVVLTGPASGQSNFLGFSFRTTQTAGVPCHRIGMGGYTVGEFFGGVYNGLVGTADGTNFFTAAAQLANIQSNYIWNPTKGVVVIHTGGNEQSNQLNATGLTCGVTPALYQTLMQQVVNQIALDGWCTLLVGPNATGSENVTPVNGVTPAPSTAYTNVLQSIAANTDHCAFVDVNALWGGADAGAKAAVFAAGLRDQNSAHPTRKGYGDIARVLHRVLDGAVAVGN